MNILALTLQFVAYLYYTLKENYAGIQSFLLENNAYVYVSVSTRMNLQNKKLDTVLEMASNL